MTKARTKDDPSDYLVASGDFECVSCFLFSSLSPLPVPPQEYFLRPVLTSTLLRDGQPPGCSVQECQNHIMEDCALTFCKAPIKYVSQAQWDL